MTSGRPRGATVALGISWDDSKSRTRAAAACALAIALSALASGSAGSLSRSVESLVSVIVRERPAAGDEPERAVEDLGGSVQGRLGLIGGFVAQVPAGSVGRLSRVEGVAAVTPNHRLGLLHAVDGFDATAAHGSMHSVAKMLRVPELWEKGITGKNVDVALVDSGVSPVNGTRAPGKVLNGPDLSFESQNAQRRHLDSFGHGTHMAGIIAGLGDGAATSGDYKNHDTFTGVAPDARIVNVKVASRDGATDVSQVIAAIDWVVQHRRDAGMNIRVLNLSFGTDGTQDYRLDPLSYAVDIAWTKGIAVIVAAGNEGRGGTRRLSNPAVNPFVVAVGASETAGALMNVRDDVVPEWSSRGDGVRNPDVVAPGTSIASLRVPGSFVDETYPQGRVNAALFKGSGTSQAAAVVSGLAALVLQHRPDLTPDQLKALLRGSAVPLGNQDASAQGAGLVSAPGAAFAPTPQAPQRWERARGAGSLDAARGSSRVAIDGVTLSGERDIFGTAWDAGAWAGLSASESSWNGGTWNGNTWTGSTWSGASWSGASWEGATWSGNTWTGATWSGNTWTGATWSGNTWTGATWSGSTWSSESWE